MSLQQRVLIDNMLIYRGKQNRIERAGVKVSESLIKSIREGDMEKASLIIDILTSDIPVDDSKSKTGILMLTLQFSPQLLTKVWEARSWENSESLDVLWRAMNWQNFDVVRYLLPRVTITNKLPFGRHSFLWLSVVKEYPKLQDVIEAKEWSDQEVQDAEKVVRNSEQRKLLEYIPGGSKTEELRVNFESLASNSTARSSP